jgi:hypothetical protein
MTEEYVYQMLACARGLVDGSIIGVPYRRAMGGQLTIGNAATYGRATIVHNLNNIHTIKGALRSLVISEGALTPRYIPYTAYYTATVDANTSKVLVTPTVLADTYESLTINGKAIDSGTAYEAMLTNGENRFSIEVTASDKTKKVYTLTVFRGNSSPNRF